MTELISTNIDFDIAEKRLHEIAEKDLNLIEYPGIKAHVRNWTFPINSFDCSTVKQVLVIVPSAVANWEARQAVRKTWGEKSKLHKMQSRVIFLVGLTHNTTVTESLIIETNIYGDVVQVDIMDSYHNLSLKSIGMLKWLHSYCPQPKYIAKIDEDNVINFSNILNHLEKLSESNEKFFTGDVRRFGEPHTEGKWMDPIYPYIYQRTYFPTYVGGPGYIFTNNFLEEWLTNCEKKPFHHLEDVFVTGICTEGLDDIPRVIMPGWNVSPAPACYMVDNEDFTLAHGYETADIIATWDMFIHSERFCL